MKKGVDKVIVFVYLDNWSDNMTDDTIWKKASGRGKPGAEPAVPRGVPNADIAFREGNDHE